jgi:protein SCO1/2
MLFKTALAAAGSTLLPAASSPARPGPRAAYFPNALLQTHEGKQVRFYDDVVKGDKIVVFNMMYTVCANICPPNTANLLQVQQMLGDRVGRDIFFYSLTLRPEMDTPAALRDYAKLYGVKPGWTFLTGGRADLDAIRRKLGFFDRDPLADQDLSLHTGMIRIGNEAYDRWSMMPTLLTPRQLVNSIIRI